MSIDLSLIGDFELTPELEAKLRASIRNAEELESRTAEFRYCNSVVTVAGFYHRGADAEVPGGAIPHRSVLSYGVNDKDLANAALAAVVRSVVECLPAIPGGVALLYPDFPVMARVAGKVTLYRHYPEPGDFWDAPGRKELVPPPYEVTEYPLPEPDEDDLEDDEDDS